MRLIIIGLSYRLDSIFCCTSFNASGVTVSFSCAKFRSLALFNGMRCIWACGTSMPTTLMPQRLQSKLFSIAFAMGLANTSISARYSSDKSKRLSTSIWNDEGVPHPQWKNIQKSVKFIIFGYFVRRNFARYNF